VRFNRRPTIVVDKSYIRKEIRRCNWHKYTFDVKTFTKVFNILDKYKHKWAINIVCDNWYRVTYAGLDTSCCGTFNPIGRMFYWRSTPEGYEFWGVICDKYLECV